MSIEAVIVGMLIVTFVPRLVPFLITAARTPPAWLANVLAYVPPAALAALIVPGGLTAAAGSVTASLSALVVAAILTLWRGNITLTLTVSVGVAAVLLALVG